MEEVILAEELLDKIEGLLTQIEDTVGGTFVMTEELLHQLKEELEDITNL
jgi:uncharacterized protein YoxC